MKGIIMLTAITAERKLSMKMNAALFVTRIIRLKKVLS